MTRSEAKQGERNPAWRGADVGYVGVHAWFYKQGPRPTVCPKCASTVNIEACNISGEYKRDVADWEYLCRKCHMEKDGRNDRLRASGRSRKLPNKICRRCSKEFHTDKHIQLHCSRSCLSAAGGPKGYNK